MKPLVGAVLSQTRRQNPAAGWMGEAVAPAWHGGFGIAAMPAQFCSGASRKRSGARISSRFMSSGRQCRMNNSRSWRRAP